MTTSGPLPSNLRQIDVWSYLDSITTHPAGSQLLRVDINISYSAYENCEELEQPDEENLSLMVYLYFT